MCAVQPSRRAATRIGGKHLGVEADERVSECRIVPGVPIPLFSIYSALGALRQDPGRAAESAAGARTCGIRDPRSAGARGVRRWAAWSSWLKCNLSEWAVHG